MRFFVLDKPFLKTLITIALPVAFQNLIMSSLNMVDTIMVGQLGEAAIAAVSVSNQFFSLFASTLYAVCSGASVFASQYWGTKEIRGIRRTLGLSLCLCLIMVLIFSLPAIVFSSRIISFFSPDRAVIGLGAGYLRIIGFSFGAAAISFSFSFLLRSIEKPWLSFKISTVSLGLNAALNYCLIFGSFGFPELGIRGAAIATLIARIFEAALMVGCVYGRRYPLAASLRELIDFPRGFVPGFLKVWFPILLNDFAWISGMAFNVRIYGQISTAAVAAVSITDTVIYFSVVFFLGTCNATAVTIGKTIGAHDPKRAYSYGRQILFLMPLLGLCLNIPLLAASPFIPHLFNIEPAVRKTVTLLIIMHTVTFPFKVFNLHLVDGLLRSGADTKYGMFLDLLGVWGIGVPLCYCSALVWRLSVPLVFLITSSEEIIKAFIGLRRFRSRKWINNIIG